MKIKKLWILAVIFLLLSCTMITTKENNQTIGNTEKSIQMMKNINEQYPGLDTPRLGLIKKIYAPDKFLLNNGNLLILAGVVSPQMEDQERNKRYFSYERQNEAKFLMLAKDAINLVKSKLRKPDTNIVYIPIRTVATCEKEEIRFIITAYIWIKLDIVEPLPDGLKKDEQAIFTNINELLLLNGLGIVDSKLNHPLSKRYRGLERIAKLNKLGLWRK